MLRKGEWKWVSMPGIEPAVLGWKPGILTTRSHGLSSTTLLVFHLPLHLSSESNNQSWPWSQITWRTSVPSQNRYPVSHVTKTSLPLGAIDACSTYGNGPQYKSRKNIVRINPVCLCSYYFFHSRKTSSFAKLLYLLWKVEWSCLVMITIIFRVTAWILLWQSFVHDTLTTISIYEIFILDFLVIPKRRLHYLDDDFIVNIHNFRISSSTLWFYVKVWRNAYFLALVMMVLCGTK